MFKKISKILTLALAILVAATYVVPSFDMSNIAYAGGGTEYVTKERFIEVKEKEYLVEANKNVDLVKSGFQETDTYAMVLETGLQAGYAARFFLIKYYDPDFGMDMVRRIDPDATYTAHNQAFNADYRTTMKSSADSLGTYISYAETYVSNSTIYQGYLVYYNYINSTYGSIDNAKAVLSKTRTANDRLGKAQSIADKFGPSLLGTYNQVAKSIALSSDSQASYNAGKNIMNGDYNYGNVEEALARNTTTTLFFAFKDSYEIKEVDVFMKEYRENGYHLDSWAIQKWDIYKVNDKEEISRDMYSGVSDSTFINFTGQKKYTIVNITDTGLAVQGSSIQQELDDESFDCNLICIPLSGTRKLTSTSAMVKDEEVTASDNKIFPRMQKYTTTKDLTYCDVARDRFTAVINIPDLYGSGLERLAKGVTEDSYHPKEQLRAEIAYLTAEGYTRTAKIPITTNALIKAVRNLDADKNELKNVDSNKKLLTGGDVLTFAQQGDKIVFDLNLPNCSKIQTMTIKYEYLQGDEREDLLRFNSIKIYRKNDVKAVYDFTSYFLSPVVTATSTPVFSYDATYYDGIEIYCNNDDSFWFKEGGTNDYPQKDEVEYQYLVSLRTSDIDLAATDSNILFALKYETTSGKESVTKEYSLADSAESYYGNWKGYDLMHRANVEAAYRYNMRAGGEYSFIIQAKDVSQFTGFTARLADGDTNEWQLDGITITELSSLSERKAKSVRQALYEYDKGKTPYERVARTVQANGIETDRYYYRDYTGDQLENYNELYILVKPDKKVTYNFYENNTEIEEEERNFDEKKYSMDWATANSDLKFMTEARTYTVNVTVPSNASQNVIDDGCGSRNLFYFQLVFTKGSSGYVLANSQMTTDGFIANSTSSFTISTNEDLGDISAINIIPDDLDENSDILDKLYISKITVIKNNHNGINRRFVFNINSWLEREYHSIDENGLKTHVTGRKPSELIITYPVSTSAYELKYEVAITTESLSVPLDATTGKPITMKTADGQEVPYNLETWSTAMNCDIKYRNSAGEEQTYYGFDIIKAIYEYKELTPIVKGETKDDARYVSNPKEMLQPGKTDRFYISLEDAVSIMNMKISFSYSDFSVVWTFKRLAISVVTSDGALYINKDNEYQMKYTNPDDPRLVVDEIITTNQYKVDVSVIDGKPEIASSKTFGFKENQIPAIDGEDGKITVVPRVPESVNDTIDVYLHTTPDATDPSDIPYNLLAILTYEGAHNNYNAKAYFSKPVKQADGSLVFALKDLDAQNFVTARSLTIQSDVLHQGGVYAELQIPLQYAVVQQFRNNGTVMISSQVMSFTNADPSLMRNGVSATSVLNESQLNWSEVVDITFAANTSASTLAPMNYDLAFALNYYTSETAAQGTQKKLIRSPYIYLSDQGIDSIGPGQTAQITFTQPYVGDIQSITVVPTGGITATLQGVTVTKYAPDRLRGDAVKRESTAYALGATPIEGGSTFEQTNAKLVPVKFTFTTHEAQEDVNSGTSDPVSITINYLDAKEHQLTKTVDDITSYVGGVFKTGETQSVNLFINDFAQIRNIEIEPSTSWSIDKVGIDYEVNVTGQDGKTETRTDSREIAVNKTIYNGVPHTVNFAEISVDVAAKAGSLSRRTVNTALEDSMWITTTDHPEGLKFTIKIKNTVPGQGYKLELIKVNGDATAVVDTQTNLTDSGTYTFVPSAVNGEEQYVLQVTSTENNTIKASIPFKVTATY